jgi:hypothetical protein
MYYKHKNQLKGYKMSFNKFSSGDMYSQFKETGAQPQPPEIWVDEFGDPWVDELGTPWLT